MKIFKYTIAIALFSALCLNTHAQDRTFDFNLFLGYNIGATAPIPIPAEVRKIESYNPKFNPSMGLNIGYRFNNKWGAGTGIAVDWKGMRVKDEVKYMYTSITTIQGNDKFTGYFVGKNMTNIDMPYRTVPIYAPYNFNEKWSARLGIYAAKALYSKFNGSVNNGYIRVGTPTGQKQEIDGDGATFDFSEDIRDYDCGLQAGGEYKRKNRVGCYANLNWGLVPCFTKTAIR